MTRDQGHGEARRPYRSRRGARIRNGLVLRSAIVASLGGLLFGFDTAVISGTTQQLTRFYELSPGGLGFTVATALLGTYLERNLGIELSEEDVAAAESGPRGH